MNQILVWAVVQDFHPFYIFLLTLIIIFILSIVSTNILKNTNGRGAYTVWISAMVLLCIMRPMAGLSWYYNSNSYSETIIFISQICAGLIIVAIGLYLVGVLKQKGGYINDRAS